MKKVNRFYIVFFALVSLSSCTELWGKLDDPADPKASAYQGYETVSDASAVKPVANAPGVAFPRLVCAKLIGAQAYQYQISDSSSFVSILYTSGEATTNAYSPADCSSLIAGTTYYWRVRVKKGGTWSAYSSSSASFSIAALNAISPSDAGTTSDTTPLLDWNDVTGVSGYELQIAATSGGVASATAVALTASQYQTATALALGTWYWRVRAKNADSVWGAWSATWSFTIVAPLVNMVDVPGGTFQMGSSAGYSDELPIHSVTVSAFKISKYEITQAQYTTVTLNSPSYFTGDTSRPVEEVTWYDAVEFCNKLSTIEGLNSVYTITDRTPASGYPITSATVTADLTKNGYRLPTEAQWEYAARGGASSQGYTYSGSNTVGTVAWYSDNSGSTTHTVGTKTANELGLYDMSGNVWEWCWDWYGSYGSSAQTNPTGASSGSIRVQRGGSWSGSADYVRSAGRALNSPGSRNNLIGFRVSAP